MKKYLISGGLWAFLGKVTTVVMGVFLLGMLARSLSPEAMGTFFIALNLATFFSIVGRAGLTSTLLRFISQALEQQQLSRARDVVYKGLVLIISGAMIAGLIAFFLLPWLGLTIFHSEALYTVVFFISLWSVVLVLQFALGELFRGFQDIKSATVFGGGLSAVASVLLVGGASILSENLTLQSVLVLIIFGLILNAFFAFRTLHKTIENLPESTKEKASYSEIIQHSWPLFVNSIILFLLSQSDLWLLGAYATDEDVALYGAASRLVMLVAMSLIIANAILPPLIARLLVQKETCRLELVLRSVATLTAIPAFAIFFVFIFFADEVMGLVYGEFYTNGGEILLILCIGQVVNVWVGSCGNTLIMGGYRKLLMAISVVSIVIAVSLGFYLMSTYGVIGLAVAYAIGTISQQGFMLLFARIYCGVWTHSMFNIFKAWVIFKEIK